jgi:hypothetical protein
MQRAVSTLAQSILDISKWLNSRAGRAAPWQVREGARREARERAEMVIGDGCWYHDDGRPITIQ